MQKNERKEIKKRKQIGGQGQGKDAKKKREKEVQGRGWKKERKKKRGLRNVQESWPFFFLFFFIRAISLSPVSLFFSLFIIALKNTQRASEKHTRSISQVLDQKNKQNHSTFLCGDANGFVAAAVVVGVIAESE